MNDGQIEAMVSLVLDNLHLLGYKVVSIDEKTVTLSQEDKLSYVPLEEFVSLFNVHISYIKYALDKHFE